MLDNTNAPETTPGNEDHEATRDEGDALLSSDNKPVINENLIDNQNGESAQ